ncbi:MAG: hypothetical protein KBF35_09010 [Saprospiraceae bacterium]|nr:hypothetical protein [Saprospiraceae bacterium]
MQFSDRFKTEESKALFEKGGEIIELVSEIAALIPEDNEILNEIARFMREDSYVMQVKIVGAEGGGLYDIKMECAALIRKAGRDLYVQKHSLEMFDFEYVSYMDLLREKIDEYKVLFKEWVSTFDPYHAIKDDWGLFNPPGIELPDADDDAADFFEDEDDD